MVYLHTDLPLKLPSFVAKLGFASSMLEKTVPNIFSQMVVKDGDLPWWKVVKKMHPPPKKKIQVNM